MVFRFVAEPEPVLTRDEFRDALNPSVTGRMNLYSVYDGQQWHTALATTDDGVHWQKQGIVLRAAPGSYIAANGSALSYAGQVWYWYETGTKDRLRISLARSADARTWRAEAAPVLDAWSRGFVGRARRGGPLRDPHRRVLLHVLSGAGSRGAAAHRRGAE